MPICFTASVFLDSYIFPQLWYQVFSSFLNPFKQVGFAHLSYSQALQAVIQSPDRST